MSIVPPPNNFKDFRSYVEKYGFSLSNFYDVVFKFDKSLQLKSAFNTNLITGVNLNTTDPDTVEGLLRAYAEECTIPGYQISTGEYRLTNSPQLKYAYGIVNNEINFSFICDADSSIRRSFDSWINFIYGQVSPTIATPLNPNGLLQLGRTRYRDDYCTNIVVVKYERYASSKKNTYQKVETGLSSNLTSFHLASDIIPDFNSSIADKQAQEFTSGFGKSRPVYSVLLQNAFPTNVSSLALSSGSSQLLKLQVTFEYETAVSSALVGGSTLDSGSYQTITQ